MKRAEDLAIPTNVAEIHPRDLGVIASLFADSWLRYIGLLFLCLFLYLPGQMSLPPVDRDEARFAQATKQMVESRDFIDIRFQDEGRYNKPIGAYWLQSASVELTGAVREIWAYRLPSWLSATAAVLLTASFATALFGPLVGALAGVVLASSILLGIEARLAKADAIMLTCTVLSQSILARLYVDRFVARWSPLLFWIALGAGILVKGPIIVFVVLSTVLVLSVSEQNFRWLAPLRLVVGGVVVLAIVAPWLVTITLRSGGAFWRDSLGADLVAKMVSVQESHGGPPGYYLFTVFLTFWPWSPLLLPGGWFAWRNRRSAKVRFCLAWIVPTWVVLEMVPTKLPHYTLPVFPALAALAAAGALSSEIPAWIRRIVVWHAASLSGMVLLGLAGAVWMLDSAVGAIAAVSSLLIGGFALFNWNKWRHNRVLATTLSLGAVVLLYATYFGWLLPRAGNLWLSRSASALIEQHRQDVRSPLVSVGYTEPSLVFLCGTSTILEVTGDGGIDDATRRLRATPSTLVLIDATLLPRFTEPFTELGRVRGINYSKGTKLELVLVTGQTASPR